MRGGSDARLPYERNDPQHTLVPVYCEMLLQICSSFPGLPDARTLKLSAIRFFYEGRREALKNHTAPKSRKTEPKPFRRYK